MYRIKDRYDEQIIKACKNNDTMSAACAEVGLHFNTFKRRALKLGVYKPNQGSKGLKRENISIALRYDLNDILNGKYPYYQTNKLKIRLLKENIIEDKCNRCGIEKWNNNKIVKELNHIDGNRFNHKLDNLELLCPNCHSQTKNYRGKNINGRK